MKSFVVPLVATIAVTLVAQPSALAQYYNWYGSETGPYFRAGIGPAFTQDGMVDEFTGFPSGNEIEYRTGLAVEGAIGYAFNDCIAIEIEGGFIGNELRGVEGFAHNDTFLSYAPLLVGVTLQQRIPQTIVTPYVRAAFGGAATMFDTDGFSNGTVTLVGEDSDLVFAYQFSAGLRFDFNDQMSLGAGYKYFVAEDSTFKYESLFGGGPDVRLGIEGIRSHVVLMTFNMKF
jgi:opacity protein-like surface antigen